MKHRALLLVAPLIGVFLFVTAGAAGGVGRITVSDATPRAGAAITVTSTGWSPGAVVTVGLDGTDGSLARVAADATGAVRARITVPTALVLDVNVLSAVGRSASGVPQQIVTALAVHGPGAPDGTRPWGLITALGGIAGALLILSVVSAKKPVARLATS